MLLIAFQTITVAVYLLCVNRLAQCAVELIDEAIIARRDRDRLKVD